MGLVKKMEAGDKIQSPTLTYENVGTYNADVISTAFTEGLEQYANSLGLQGLDKLDFLNAGAQMAKAIKDGNVSKKANGQFSINGSYGLNNYYTEEDVQKLKDEDAVGRGAKPYEGQPLRSFGIFTTKNTKNFRNQNNILGLVGNYLNKILAGKATIEAEKEKAATSDSKIKGTYSFATAFNDINLGGNKNLLRDWEKVNTTPESRIQSIINTLENADYTRWANSIGNISEQELKQSAGSIIEDLKSGSVDTAKDKALKLGFSINQLITEQLPKTTEEALEKEFREEVIKQNHLEHADENVINLWVLRVKDSYANKYQEILESQWQADAQKAWQELLNNPDSAGKSYEWTTGNVENIFNGLVFDWDDLDIKYQLGLKNPKKLKVIEKLYDDIYNNINDTAAEILRLSTIIEKSGDADVTKELSDLQVLTHRFLTSYDSIYKFFKNVKGKPRYNLFKPENYFSPIKEGLYKGWILLKPGEVDNGKYSIIFNIDKSSPDKGKIKRIPSSLINFDAFKEDYEKINPKTKALFILSRKEGGVLFMKEGWVLPASIDSSDPELKSDAPVTTTSKDPELSEQTTIKESLENDLSAQDISRLTAMVGDIVSLFGGVAGAVGGLASIGGGATADIMDYNEGKMSGWDATSNIAQNVGLSILGLIPGVGFAKLAKYSKSAKYVSSLSKLLKRSLQLMAHQGIIVDTLNGQYADIYNKISEGRFEDITWEDAKCLTNALSSVIHATGKHPRQIRTNNQYSDGRRKIEGTATIKTAEGKSYDVPVDAFEELANAQKSKRNSVFQSIQRQQPGFKEENLLNLPESRQHWLFKKYPDLIVEKSDFKLKGGTYTDLAGNKRLINPPLIELLYINGAGKNLTWPQFEWAKKVINPAKLFIGNNLSTGKIVELPQGTVETNGIFKTPNGYTFEKTPDGFFKRVNQKPVTVNSPNAAGASEAPNGGAVEQKQNTPNQNKKKKKKKHQNGGTLEFADSVITKFSGGGRAGITQNSSWIDSGGREALQEALNRLTKTHASYKGDSYWQVLNTAQDSHSQLYNASNFANTKGKTYYSGDDVTDYQTKYNQGGWNEISIWPKYDSSYTILSSNSEHKDAPGTTGIDGRYAGITDFRRILGRKGDWDGKESELNEIVKKFKDIGYDYYLDEASGYYKVKPLTTVSDETGQQTLTGSKTNSGDVKEGLKKNTEGREIIIPSNNDLPANDSNLKLNINWGNVSEALRTAFLNAQNTRAVKQAMNYRIPLKGYIHRMEILEGNPQAKYAAEKQSADLKSLLNQPFTSDADKHVGALLAATGKGNELKLEAALKDADRFYETRHKIQNIQNEDMLENLNRRDYNAAAIAEKSRVDANLKANNTIENARNISNLWAGFNQQLFENLSRRQQLYNTYIHSKAANDRDAHYREYITAASKPGANLDQLKQKYLDDTLKIYDKEYNDVLNLLSTNPFITSYPIIKSSKGSKLTASERYILESNKDFNKALRENRKEFHKDIRETNKRRRKY